MENQVEIIKQVNDQEAMDSRDVAKMIGKTHAHLMRDIDRYINDMEPDPKLDSAKFFIKSSYIDPNNQARPCYLLTKQGCEFVANKLTGKKGTIFTATYVGLFNEYQEEHNGNMIGVSPIAIGKWANKLGVKRDADMSYRDHDGAWRYFPEALRVFRDNALEIQDDDLGL